MCSDHVVVEGGLPLYWVQSILYLAGYLSIYWTESHAWSERHRCGEMEILNINKIKGVFHPFNLSYIQISYIHTLFPICIIENSKICICISYANLSEYSLNSLINHMLYFEEMKNLLIHNCIGSHTNCFMSLLGQSSVTTNFEKHYRKLNHK